MDLIFVSIDGNVEDAKQALRNAGYEVGEFEDMGNGVGNMEVDEACVRDLESYGTIDVEYNGTRLQAEMP